MSQPTIDQIVAMYGCLKLPVTDDERKIESAYNELRPHYHAMIDDERVEAESWFRQALTVRDAQTRQRLLDVLYTHFRTETNKRFEILHHRSPDTARRTLLSLAMEVCTCDETLAEHFVDRYLDEYGIQLENPALECAVIGPESVENLRLADTLRAICGKGNIRRHLELETMRQFAATVEAPNIIFLDVLGYDLETVTTAIGDIRRQYPASVFVLYVDKAAYSQQKYHLPGTWATRFGHYLRLYKMDTDTLFEPVVRRVVQTASALAEAVFMSRSQEEYPDPVMPVTVLPPRPRPENIAFVCYARQDWDGFVSHMVESLRGEGFALWIDQHLHEGGDVWMDAVGEALDRCKVLILVVNETTIESPTVKMAYRFFAQHNKPVVPLLLTHDVALPPELALYPALDFSQPETALETLTVALERHIKRAS